MKIIINADDFGYSSDVNSTIEKVIKNGLITSTSILSNMPGFEEAAVMAKTKDLIDRVGVHLNLFEGKPITKEMQECRVFCDEKGTFQKYRIKFLDPLKIKSGIIYNELSAQIDKVLSTGIKPTHLDSHGNLHANYFIGRIVIKLAKQYNIPSIRINRNVHRRRSQLAKMKIELYNLRLKWHGIKCSDYLGNIPDVTSALPELNGIVEVIAHPVSKNGSILDSEYEGELTHLLSPFQEFEKISYAKL